MIYSIDQILKINEIFHDVEAVDYYHPDIMKYESIHWQKIGEKIIKNKKKPITILDIGTGKGFVPLQIGRFLTQKDLLFLSDISSNLFNECRKNLEKESKLYRSKFIKCDGKIYNLEPNTIDIISVLHHIPNFSNFFKEINKLLKKKDIL